MSRLGETRAIGALFGLAVGLAVAVAPAHATHILLGPGDSGIAAIGEPIVIFGVVDANDVPAPGGDFTHTYNFGFNIDPGPNGQGGVSATPNFLQIGSGAPIAGFDMFQGVVTGPGLPAGGVALIRDEAAQIPRINRIAVEFAAVDTGSATPYQLTITGSLLPGVLVGNYTGDIGVTPLPAAALVLLSALGGLFAVRRRQAATATAAAA